ncbi:hypothetical protein THII_1939 [Thioploca ingrica]|uniref:DUF433 domain-containing protein n=1 Tax=Thioploca ingrica TaxID=40754 RepID=A0A090BV49_9GAMM|nr:hypothetical protein THII_1939 [Thioploca ingrica]
MFHEELITIDPDLLHGTPVFRGTRVPIETLFDYLINGNSINEFLDDFPTVNADLVKQVLERSKLALVA